MTHKLNHQSIGFTKLRIEKHVDSYSIVFDELIDLCNQITELIEENSFLKEKLFELSLTAPSDQQWENIVTAKLAYALHKNKKDYLEFTNSINNDIFVITIQKKFGQTPEQLREQSEIRRLKAVKKSDNLLQQNKQMQKKLSEQEKDINVLIALKMANPEERLKTQEEIQRAIDRLNVLIKAFNMSAFRPDFGKLHISMRNSFHEAWSRAISAETKVTKLEKENKALQQKLLLKKHPISRIKKRGK